MKIESLKVADLSVDPSNVRAHGDRNIEAIAGSLRRFGQQKPIVVDKSGVVRAGNGTLEAARRLGWETVEVAISELTGSEMTAYAIADNRTAELAEWDDRSLASTLEGLQFESEELLATAGYTGEELKSLLESLGQFDVDGIDAPGLADGDREPFQQMTFTLHDDQAEAIKAAMDKAKAAGPFGGPNENSNGNALARIAEAYCG